MTQSTALDKVESMARAIEFLVHFSDKDVWSPEDELAAVCALAERFDADAITGKHEHMLSRIPDGQREHTGETFNEAQSHLFIQVQNDLGI